MNRFWPGCRSKDSISPGVGGARLTQPPLDPAVNVFRKNDSLAIIRFKPPNSPPPLPMPVFISTPCCAAMAPGSALIDSPGERSTVSSV